MNSAPSTNGHRPLEATGFHLPEAQRCVIRLTADDCPSHPPLAEGVRHPECAAARYAGVVAVFNNGATVAEAMQWERWKNEGMPISYEGDPTKLTFYEDLQRVVRRYLLSWNLRERRLVEDEPEVLDADGIPSPNWQADDHGTPIWFPVPPTAEDLMRQPFDLARELYWRFWTEVAGIRPKSSTTPSAGSPSEPGTPSPENPPPSTPRRERRSRARGSLKTP